MLTLEIIANYAEIVGAIAVLFAIAFALLEFRQLGVQRREYASLEMMRSWQSPEYVDAIFEILQLEDHTDPDVLRNMSDAHQKMAFRVSMTFEALGMMAYRGTLDVNAVNDLMGGAVCTSWRSLDLWIGEFRGKHNTRAFEWYEWLAAQLEAMQVPDIAGT